MIIKSAPPVALRESQVAQNLSMPMTPDGIYTEPNTFFTSNGAVIDRMIYHNRDRMDLNDLYQGFTGPQGNPLVNVDVDPLGDPFNRPNAPKIVNA